MANWNSIDEIVADVKSGKTTALKNVNKALELISKNKEYNTTIIVLESAARERAELIDSGEKNGRLAGVPFMAKDNFLVFGGETTAGSNILKGFRAPYQSTAIEKLEAEGAICVAKSNMDAFGHGASTENSDFGVTLNPHDKTRVAGGSSGGSAAAVALRIVPFALGTDTGGSIRQPASFCGVVGMKPTYGLVSRSGVIAMASSTDCIGPITSGVPDAQIVLDVISGKDPLDSTTIERDPKPYTENSDMKGKKIGVIKEYMKEGVDPSVKKQIELSVEKLKKLGMTVEEVSLPSVELALAVYYIVVSAEISSNLSRYDGQRFGHSSKHAKNLDESYELSRSEGFGKEAKRRIMIGTYVLSSGYYDAYYKKAQTVRTKLSNDFEKIFKEFDFLIGPVAPTPAFKVGQNTDDPLTMYLQDVMTVGASLVGIPSISVPTNNTDLPIGLQIMSSQGKDREVLSLAKAYEDAS
ncbi:MAG: Asp-tRNA(Asn)/Glu-tRNA(Gln) amidotransferase subunit GatA [bacterium]|nr:Asp-tRNA(Asn)/Glu-tRNA(Gln) amidotransferase subunit GatA [bacterium]